MKKTHLLHHLTNLRQDITAVLATWEITDNQRAVIISLVNHLINVIQDEPVKQLNWEKLANRKGCFLITYIGRAYFEDQIYEMFEDEEERDDALNILGNISNFELQEWLFAQHFSDIFWDHEDNEIMNRFKNHFGI